MRREKTLNGHEKFLQSLSMLLLVLKKKFSANSLWQMNIEGKRF